MEETKKNPAPEKEAQEPMKLDDARRVKVLSPGMLVFKRFIRNKLAIVGSVILIFMFLFSFLGAAVSPYGQKEVFYTEKQMQQDYASAAYNTELRFVAAEDVSFGNAARAEFTLAKNNNKTAFTSGGTEYSFYAIGDSAYAITQLVPVADIMKVKLTPAAGETVSAELEAAAREAQKAGQSSFVFEDTEYVLTKVDKLTTRLSKTAVAAVASLNIFDAVNNEDAACVSSLAFRLAAEEALAADAESFVAEDVLYTVSGEEDASVICKDGEAFAGVSDIIVSAVKTGDTLSSAFKAALRNAIAGKESSFTLADASGAETVYQVIRGNINYTVTAGKTTTVIDMYGAPSRAHWLGTDNNGMDVLTRLMYGGRVSLMVGFIVVIIETVIGVIVGGIAGYFGGWVDQLLMRFVDLFNSIPFYPIVIIFGSVMDTLQVSPQSRIYLLMLVLGLLGWTADARTVRGQILSLREQDFMVATEATGIRPARRIFRHLVPNVMPLLIVSATAGLGGIIISEATLGFLGLGVKYPLASWGSIINTASDAYVMTNYWFMWIPAGLLILLTVLGFNFVGDGLRDAYDPKMKR